jgi:hypothetical protein
VLLGGNCGLDAAQAQKVAEMRSGLAQAGIFPYSSTCGSDWPVNPP